MAHTMIVCDKAEGDAEDIDGLKYRDDHPTHIVGALTEQELWALTEYQEQVRNRRKSFYFLFLNLLISKMFSF